MAEFWNSITISISSTLETHILLYSSAIDASKICHSLTYP